MTRALPQAMLASVSESRRPERDISRLDELRALLLPVAAVAGLALLLAAVSLLVAGLAGSGPVGEPAPRPTPPALATVTPTPAVAGSLCSPPQDPAMLPWPVSSVAIRHEATSSERLLRGPGDPETGPHLRIRAQTSVEPVEGSRWVTLADREVAVHSEPLSGEARAWWREGNEQELCPYVNVALRWAELPSGERERILLEIVATIPPIGTFPASRVEIPGRPPPGFVQPPPGFVPPPPRPRGMYTVWLVDIETGSVVTLFEVPDDTRMTYDPIFFAAFDETGPGVSVGFWEPLPDPVQTLLRFTLDGTETHRGEWTGFPGTTRPVCRDPRWTEEEGPVEVDGQPYEDVFCGSISPDGRWMTYEVRAGEDALGRLTWDQWAVDLRTSERWLLKEGLVDCGGCGGIFGPTWSPSGRYLYFTDLIWDGWVFLSDMQERATREIFAGPVGFYEPSWSPVADLLLYRRSGATVLEDLDAGLELVLEGMGWPAAFDPTGRYVYSPAWGSPPIGGATSIFHVASGRLVASLPGVNRGTTMPHFVHFTPAVVGVEDGFVAALEGAPDCDGTAIYLTGALVTCIVDAAWSEISPDGAKVVLARKTDQRGQIGEVLIVEVATGTVTTPVVVVLSEWYGIRPSYTWNAAGTYLLVRGLAHQEP